MRHLIFAVLLLFAFPAAGFSELPLLGGIPVQPLSHIPADAVVRDVNGDGFSDLLTCGGASVTISFGTGSGQFFSQVSYQVGAFPNRLVVQDLDGDGLLDIATPCAGSNTLSILFGLGNGQFSNAASASVPAELVGATAGDFDHDGVNELFLTSGSSTSMFRVRILNRLIQDVSAIDIGVTQNDMASADMNGDGNLDLVIAVTTGVRLLEGNGSGQFQPIFSASTSLTDGQTSRVIIDDIDQDQMLDIVALTSGFPGATYVFFGLGNGGFSSPVRLVVGRFSKGLCVSDLESNGYPDIVVGNNLERSIHLIHNLGTRSLSVERKAFTMGGLTCVAAGDLDGDGSPDLVFASGTGSSLGIALNASETLERLKVIELSNQPGWGMLADLTGDQVPDLGCVNPDQTVSLFRNEGNGALVPLSQIALDSNPINLVRTDFNLDTISDIAVSLTNGKVQFLLGMGSGEFSSGGSFWSGAQGMSLISTTINGDEYPDIVTTSPQENLVVLLLSEHEAFYNGRHILQTGPSPVSVTAADFNNDGTIDLADVSGLFDSRGGLVSVHLSQGNGLFLPRSEFRTVGIKPLQIVSGYINSDWYPDLVVLHDNDVVTVHLGQGDGTFVSASHFLAPPQASFLALSDLNGDLNRDVAINSELNQTVALFMGRGDGTFNLADQYGVGGQSWVGLGDLDGNYRPDLVTLDDSHVTVMLNQHAALITSVPETPSNPPISAALSPVYPNPSSGAIKFAYSLATQSVVEIHIMDVQGRVLSRLVDNVVAPGIHTLTYSFSDQRQLSLASGTYFLQMAAGRTVLARRFTILR